MNIILHFIFLYIHTKYMNLFFTKNKKMNNLLARVYTVSCTPIVHFTAANSVQLAAQEARTGHGSSRGQARRSRLYFPSPRRSVPVADVRPHDPLPRALQAADEARPRVTFVSTPRNTARLGAVLLELAKRLRIAALELPSVEDLPHGAECTADVLLEKVGLLKKAFDGLTAPFADLAAKACAGTGGANGDAAAGLSRKPDFIVHDFGQNWIWPIAKERLATERYEMTSYGIVTV